jgi:hypothetical protein
MRGPMLDRNDSFSILIACEAAYAERVHAVNLPTYARALSNATEARPALLLGTDR